MLYLKSFLLVAPFDNDVTQVFGGMPYGYWKLHGFESIHTGNENLHDSVACQTDTLHRRGTSQRLGPYTLSDFKESTRMGDLHTCYIFSVLSTSKLLAERTIEDVMPMFKEFVEKKKLENSEYALTEVKTTVFDFFKQNEPENDTEKVDNFKREKLQHWGNLIAKIPYVDKLYEWLLINRYYPTVE